MFTGGCGSCYAFSSMGMLEARMKITYNNAYSPILSPQDIMDCSQYSQGKMLLQSATKINLNIFTAYFLSSIFFIVHIKNRNRISNFHVL